MNAPANIRVVEDELGSRVTLTALLETEGYSVDACETAGESLNHLIHHPVDIVVSDLKLPDGSGLQILWTQKKISPDSDFILVTGDATLETAVEAVNEGAFAYHVKPLDIEALKASVRNALRQQRLESDQKVLLQNVQQINEDLKQSVAQLDKKNQELRDALDKVKLLSGLLPICASCKKIRNDEGYWNEIESYIAQHSEADFTHGICPDCVRTLYPEAYRVLYPECPLPGVDHD